MSPSTPMFEAMCGRVLRTRPIGAGVQDTPAPTRWPGASSALTTALRAWTKMAIRPVPCDREPGRCVALQVQIMAGIGNDHQLQFRTGSTDRRDQGAGTCALAATGIDSR